VPGAGLTTAHMISRGISPSARLVGGMAEIASPPSSEFPVLIADGVAVVTTPSEIDIANAGHFRAALLAAAGSGRRVIVVDMTGTEFCDSTGLNVLVRARRQAEESGGEIRLAVRATALQRILTVTGVDSMFGRYDSLEQALRPGTRGGG
jgi:anti-sigma B factor antagonist